VRFVFRRTFVLLALILASVPIASAGWRTASATNEDSPSAGLIHRHLELEETEAGDSAIVDLALFSTKSCKVRIIDNPDGTASLADAVRQSNCLAGVNGGFFDPNFAPLGLRIVDGKITSRSTHGRLMSGVLASSDSITQIFRVGEFSTRRKINAAVECGPFLVDLARPIRGLEATRGARRTFAAMGSGDRAALGFCSDITLAGLARVLTIPLGDFKIQRALNLDGGSSSAFWFKRESGAALSIPEQKNVRDFVGVVAK
jgi:hypothetical protein